MSTKESTTSSEKSAKKTVTDPLVDEAAREKLITARVGLLIRSPFYGNLVTRMKLINSDDWLGTIATDGRNFYYNSEFVNKLPLRQMEFGMGHEVLHAIYDHMGRREHRDARLYNVACDFAVNADLIKGKIGDRISVVPILYDEKYEGWTSEAIYDDLMDNMDKMDKEKLCSMVLDEHLDDEGEDGDGDGDGNGNQSGSGRPKISREERQQIRDELRQSMLAAAQAAGIGNCPAGIQRILKDLTEPKLNWRDLIQQQVQSSIKSDFTWMRPSRKGWHIDAILPGVKPGERIDVAVAIDQSGSINEKQARHMLSEVKGIMEQFDEYAIHVWTFDTQVYNPQIYTNDSDEPIENYDIQGGGGTDIGANWDFMKENDICPKQLVVFTDMYSSTFGDPDYCPTIFVVFDNPNPPNPHGINVDYDPNV